MYLGTRGGLMVHHSANKPLGTCSQGTSHNVFVFIHILARNNPPTMVDKSRNKGAGKIPIVTLYVALSSAGITTRAIACKKLRNPNNCPD